MTLTSPMADEAPDHDPIITFCGSVEALNTDNRSGALYVKLRIPDEDYDFVGKLRHIRGHDLIVTLAGPQPVADLLHDPKKRTSTTDRVIADIAARRRLQKKETDGG